METEEIVGLLRVRIIGEIWGRAVVWGWELYATESGVEHSYGRWLGVTQDQDKVLDFCRRINAGAVSPLHAHDLIRDFRASLIDG